MACSLTVYVYNYESLVIFTMTLSVLDEHPASASCSAEETNTPHTPWEVAVRNAQAAVDNTYIASWSITDLPSQKVPEALQLMKLPGGKNIGLRQLENRCQADLLTATEFAEAVRRFIYGAFNEKQGPMHDQIKAIYSVPRDKPADATLIGFIALEDMEAPCLVVPIAPSRRLIGKEGLADRDSKVLQLLAVATCYRQAISSTETGCNSEHAIWLSLKNVDGGVTISTLDTLEKNGFQPTNTDSSMDMLREINPSHRGHYQFVSSLEAIVTKQLSSDTAQPSTANEAKQPVKEDNIIYPAEDHRSLGSHYAKKS